MKQTFFILTASLILTSCATIMNKSHKNVTIYTTEPSKIILERDTINTINNKTTLKIDRKNKVLKITASTDSLTKDFNVEPKNSFMYWSNIFWNYGVGMLVDKNNPKRYSYPRRIYINSTDTISKYYRYSQANNKGELYLHVSLPHINSFSLNPENERTRSNTGFWGLAIGFDYYYLKNQFLNIG